MSRGAAVLCLASLLLIAASGFPQQVESPSAAAPAGLPLTGSLEGYRLVRCHFAEGRIVIRRGEALHVLRVGDRLPETGLRVAEITSEHAVLIEASSSEQKASRLAGPPKRLLVVTATRAGGLALREYASTPEARPPRQVFQASSQADPGEIGKVEQAPASAHDAETGKER